jgi:hypothetical protein
MPTIWTEILPGPGVFTLAFTMQEGTDLIAEALDTYTVNIAQVSDPTYKVLLTPSWNTTFLVQNKTIHGFDVMFGTPGPPGGGSIDWAIG